MNLMKAIAQAIADANQKAEKIKALRLELDYQLAWLHQYIEQNDKANIDRTKERLSEIHKELTAFNVL